MSDASARSPLPPTTCRWPVRAPAPPLGAPSQGLHRPAEERHGEAACPYCGTVYRFDRRAPQGPPLSFCARLDVSAPMKILVVAPSWIGDTILAQPLLSLLKQHHPAARIEVLARTGRRRCWRAWPRSMRSSPIPSVTANSVSAPAAPSGRRLAGADYSHAYVLPNSWKSALVPFFAGIPRRIGYQGESRYLLAERTPPARCTVHHPQLVQRYAALAGPLPASLPRPNLRSSTRNSNRQHAAP
jgi:hypothetical protein